MMVMPRDPRRMVTFFARVAAFALIALPLYGLYRFDRPGVIQGHGLHLAPFDVVPNAILSGQNLTTYIRAILDPDDVTLPKLKCPLLNQGRYSYLQVDPTTAPQVHYFFALNLRNNLPLLPQLLGSVLEAIRFLGPEHCALSIVEGNSPDGTAEVLAALEPQLTLLLLRTHFALNNPTDPLGENTDRFTALATLRNLALAPLFPINTTNPTPYPVSPDATVLFINDVALCPDDILELAHQRLHQSADMACAMDWTGDADPIFYDVYVARAINGDIFFDVPAPAVTWARAAHLFWNEPVSKARLEAHQPFQVFACWNGAVAFTARPVVSGEVRFRGSRKERGECRHGEPQVFCKDLWWKGYGRIMVVPSVNLEYSVEKGRVVKERKGFVSRWVAEETGDEARIEWLPPPEMVKCMPTFEQQGWRPWNETLT